MPNRSRSPTRTNPISPETRLDRVLDSFAWGEYFRGTEAGREAREGPVRAENMNEEA